MSGVTSKKNSTYARFNFRKLYDAEKLTRSNSVMSLKIAENTYDIEELDAVIEVVSSGDMTCGEKVREFERCFARYIGTKYCVMVNSGSSANLLMMAAMLYSDEFDLKTGDEVIVPGLSWATSYSPIHQLGLRMKIVDVDIDCYNISIRKVCEAVSDSTKAVLVTNVLGNPTDIDYLKNELKDVNIAILEDNCESIGAEIGGRFAGSQGLMGTFSTYFSHQMSTIEGGMVVTDDDNLYHALLCLRSHGWSRDLPLGVSKINGLNVNRQSFFDFLLPGFNVRPTEITGALGIVQLRKLEEGLERRRANAATVREAMQGEERFKLQFEHGKSSWFGFGFVFDERYKSLHSRVLSHLSKTKVDYRPILSGNITRQPVSKFYNFSVHGELKNTNHIHDFGLYIGNPTTVNTMEIIEVIDQMRSLP